MTKKICCALSLSLQEGRSQVIASASCNRRMVRPVENVARILRVKEN